jgi:hypothetical protein
MFADGRCSIYDERPRACRQYDCRVFAVSGVIPDQPAVAERVRQWQVVGDPVRLEAIRRRAGELTATGPALGVALRALRPEEDHGPA